MENVKIRGRAKAAGVKLWEVAERCGLTDSSLSRKLRRELPEAEQKRLLEIIDQLAAEREEVR